MERIESIVDERAHGARLDRFLASARSDVSRSAIQREIRDGNVSVSGTTVTRASRRLRGGEVITWSLREPPSLAPAPIPLPVLYEDDALIAIDKPVGLVVHPGAGTTETTLIEGLLATHDLPESDDPTRPGIVHRLDKGTSGVIIVAKTKAALDSLKGQFADRAVAKSYLAVVTGIVEEDEGTIDAPVGRDPGWRSRMTVIPTGKQAKTEFQVLERESDRTLVWIRPHTGRTHQIRAHFRYIKHPVVGDDTYGGSLSASPSASKSDPRSRGPGQAAYVAQGRSASAEGRRPAKLVPVGKSKGTDEAAYVAQGRSACAGTRTRMLLHAWRLVVRHPETGEALRLEAPPPSAFPAYPYEELSWQQIPAPTDE